MPGPSTDRRAYALALGMALALHLAGLGAIPLVDPDEGRYADIARALASSDDWVVPRVNGVSFHDKPPLVLWLAALAFRALGVNAFAARLVPALFGLAGVALAVLLARAISPRPRAGWLAALVLATSPLWSAVARTLTLDVPLGALTCAGFLAIAHGAGALGRPPRYAWKLAGGVALGLATLVKGPVAPGLAGLGCVLLAAWERDARLAVRLLEPAPWALSIAIAAPWYHAFGARNPDGLIQFLKEQNLQRFQAWGEHQHGPQFFLVTLLWGLSPIAVVCALAGTAAPRAWKALLVEPAQRPARSALAFALGVVGFFSLSSSKIETYILPALPALAALVAVALDRALEDPLRAARVRRAAAATVALALLAPGGWLAFGAIAARSSYDKVAVAASGASFAAAFALAGLVPAVIAIAASRRGRAQDTLLAALLAIGCVLLSSLPVLRESLLLRSAERVSAAIAARRVPGERVAAFASYIRGLPFFLGEPVILLLTTGELPVKPFLRERPDLFVEGEAAVTRLFSEGRPLLVVVPRGRSGTARSARFLELARAAGATREAGSAVSLGRHGDHELWELWPPRRDQ